jgi:restriction endonuclease
LSIWCASFLNGNLAVTVPRFGLRARREIAALTQSFLRGGRFVIQAKRYTLPVDVAAVRDLYGTLINEGANRGILITTSHYGPDAYAFARDKPISLLTGADLIDMLRRHGRRYRIDLEEARRANKHG